MKASNSVEARLESKENSESGQYQIDKTSIFVHLLLAVTPSGGSDSVTGLRDSVSPTLPAIDRWIKLFVWISQANILVQATGTPHISTCVWRSCACRTPHFPWQSF